MLYELPGKNTVECYLAVIQSVASTVCRDWDEAAEDGWFETVLFPCKWRQWEQTECEDPGFILAAAKHVVAQTYLWCACCEVTSSEITGSLTAYRQHFLFFFKTFSLMELFWSLRTVVPRTRALHRCSWMPRYPHNLLVWHVRWDSKSQSSCRSAF